MSGSEGVAGRERPITVVLADDQPLILAGYQSILSAHPGVEVVGTADNGLDAVEMARRLRPDVCLFDIRMPGMDGIAATRELAGPDVADPLPVVIITTFGDDEYVHGALKAGAKGFLLKDAGPELLIQAVRAAAVGDALIAPSVTIRLLEAFSATAQPPPVAFEPLSPREAEVMEAVAQGLTNVEISQRLYISVSTTKGHITSLMNKLGARNRVEIAMWAYEHRSASRRVGNS